MTAEALANQTEVGVLEAFIAQHYIGNSVPSLLILSHPVDPALMEALGEQCGHRVAVLHQPREQRRVWLDMAIKGAQLSLARLLSEEGSQQARTRALVDALGLDIDLDARGVGVAAADLVGAPQPEGAEPAAKPTAPTDPLAQLRIECFDISHTAGEATQASCVVYEQHRMQSSQYRRYNITDITPGDDYAAMKQALERRYGGAKPAQLPDLVLIDGGKGQLSSVMTALKAVIKSGSKITLPKVVSLAKQEEEIFVPKQKAPIILPKDSPEFFLIQRIRDEAHRFGITHHRNKRSRETFKTELSEIKGVSDKTAQKLLTELKSVKGIKEATLAELINIIGNSKAHLVYEFFKNKENS